MVRDGKGSRTSRPIIGRCGRPRSGRPPAHRSRSAWSWCFAPFARRLSSSRWCGSALPKSSRCGCTFCRRRARSPYAHSGTAMLGPRACDRLAPRCSGLRAGLSGPLATNSTRPLGPCQALLQPVVQRPTRAATHDLGHPLRRGVLGLDPRPLLDVEDLRQPTDTLGEVQAPPLS